MSEPSNGPRFVTLRQSLTVVLPILAIGTLHYVSPPDPAWVHDVLRRLYYLPIVVAAFQSGKRSALTAALLVTLTYLPHAFLHGTEHVGHQLVHGFNRDPGDTVHKALEIVLYHVVAFVAGELADRERRRRSELEAALDERRRLERQLIRAGRLGALGELVAGIAHEIRNPLHALRGTAEVVDPLIPKDVAERRMWEIHVSELERLGRVAERFLSFATPTPVQMEVIELREVAERLVSLISADARKRNIEVASIVPTDPVWIRGDRDQLAQVGLNIAVNAMRALGDSQGHIVVIVRCEPAPPDSAIVGTAAVLRVENDGPRIAEPEREHLFDPFHSGGGGTGLGLSIAARIVEQHGGSIEVDGLGLGVGFSVLLPAVTTPDERGAASSDSTQ
ncbi:MAG: ATP-binding protein [Polyangiaceae bacterium]